MNIPTAIPSEAANAYTPIHDRNPALLLFEYIDMKFGASCKLVTLKRNSFICLQGSEIQYLYLIKKGEVILSRCSLDGGEALCEHADDG